MALMKNFLKTLLLRVTKIKERKFLSLVIAVSAIICFIFLINSPVNQKDFFDITGQLLTIVVISALTIFFSNTKQWKAAIKFSLIAGIGFIIWNLFSPIEPIKCTVDIALFKNGSGSLLSPQVFAYNEHYDFISGHLRGYTDLNLIDQSTDDKLKKDINYDQKLITAATLEWLNFNNYDWSGCNTEAMFVGLSQGSQRLDCNKKPKGIEIKLEELFGDIGKNFKFLAPLNSDIEVNTQLGEYNTIIDTPFAKVNLNLTEKIIQENLEPHKEGTEPEGIEENISRYYKKEAMPLSLSGYRMKIETNIKKLRRWSKETNEFKKWGTLFCSEFSKAFSWEDLKKSLGSTFKENL